MNLSKKQITLLREKYRKQGFKLAMKEINEARRTGAENIDAEQILAIADGLNSVNIAIGYILNLKWIGIVHDAKMKELKDIHSRFIASSALAPRTLANLVKKIKSGKELTDDNYNTASLAIQEIVNGVKKAEPLILQGFELVKTLSERMLNYGLEQIDKAIK